MNEDIEIELEEIAPSDVEPENQPMTLSKVPEDEVKYNCLSKEEVMKLARDPVWVKTRWVLVVLFWLVCLAMLANAIVIFIQAPHCKPIPKITWWHEGPLYQIPDVEAFADGMKGVEAKLDSINQLKVKGLVLGPLHVIQGDQPQTLQLQSIDPYQGTVQEFAAVMEKAHKKGICVVLDLTPNYLGSAPWFDSGDISEVMEKLKAAVEYWLGLGVDGIKLSSLNVASTSPDWSVLQAAIRGNDTEDTKARALISVVEGLSAAEVSQLINTTGVDLLLSDLLTTLNGGMERIKAIGSLSLQQTSLGWGLGATQWYQLSKQAKTPALIRLYQLLLFTLPGTPVFTYGDEIGLQAGQGSPKMVWDIEKEPVEGSAVNETAEAERKERIETKTWFITLSNLRGNRRSLLHGDYYSLSSSPTALAFLRAWDQSTRFITAVNWGAAPETLTLKLAPTEGVELPESATVMLSTDKNLTEYSSISLDKITLGPETAVLLQFHGG